MRNCRLKLYCCRHTHAQHIIMTAPKNGKYFFTGITLNCNNLCGTTRSDLCFFKDYVYGHDNMHERKRQTKAHLCPLPAGDYFIPESVKLIIDCSEKPRDNALFYAFQVFKLFTHKVQLLLPIPPSPFPKGRGRLQGTAAGVLRTPAAWLK